MGEWSFLGDLFDKLQSHSSMLGRFWLLLMLVFRILILGTVASDLFEDEQEEFACNTLQPGCKQVCYDMAFPISQYRFWVFHIVLIASPSLVFLVYAMHHSKRQELARDLRLKKLYLINVAFRMVAEVGFLLSQWWMYGFKVEAQFPCSRFPCPYTVDCFTSRPAEKTIFLCFYFTVGVVSAASSCAEFVYSSTKLFGARSEAACACRSAGLRGSRREEEEEEEGGGRRLKGAATRSGSGRKVLSSGHKRRSGRYVSSKLLLV
ncbi:gap junction delta-3 protein-like [Betta splendens]|uniref:Gap junction delta-3 protein-like n=1 Tax=Betta splendens TaxID=158456 RepID=A0A6P7LBX9_BETSP|nr:gap junction delta-3 protein-like [Betta splendens]